MLATGISTAELLSVLQPIENWGPYPSADDRAPWSNLPEDLRAILVRRGEKHLGRDWPPLHATRTLEFAREGNRSRYEAISFGRRTDLQDLVLAECVEAQGRFLDDITNGVWAICEESYWGVPAHLGLQQAGSGLPDTSEPTVDLFAAETGSTLAWTYYLVGSQLDDISPLIPSRIRREIHTRILEPCLQREDFWWMGFSETRRVNNWNPWINSNWLAALLFIEPDPQVRATTVHKILRSLDYYIEGHPKDGGCDEGPSYWGVAGASLFDCLDILYVATDGAIDVFADPLIRDIGAYIYRVHIHDRYFVNFADAPGQWVAPASLCYRFGQRVGDERFIGFAAKTWKQRDPADRTGDRNFSRSVRTCFCWKELERERTEAPCVRDSWLPEIQVAAARDEEGSDQGWYVAVKGGHNNEHHNHNDVGNVIVYRDGKPVIVDAGVGTYTAKTFSPQRYDIWTMQSAYHNLPTINGNMQRVGEEFAARDVSYESTDQTAELKLDISGAYPVEAGIRSWIRTVSLERGKEVNGVHIQDAWDLDAPPKELTLSLLTPCDVQLAEGQLTLAARTITRGSESGSAVIDFDREHLSAAVETVAIDPDDRLTSSWGGHLTRILLRATNPATEGVWDLHIQ